MNIVFVCDTMGSGGAERVISTLSNEFVKQGNNVSIIMLSSIAEEPFYKLDGSIKLVFLSSNFDKELSFSKKAKLLKRTILGINPDVVISFISYVCIYTWWALRHTKIPYIVSERNDPNHRGKIKQFLLNQSFKKASGCVFQTEDALKWYGKIAVRRSRVIYNPVNLTFIPKDTTTDKKQLLYVGRFTEQKNCLLLLDAFNHFAKEHSEYSLKMYGDGPLKHAIQEYLSKNNLSEKVIILPSSKDWQEREYNSSLFVLPSNYEGMPNVLAEALCLGLPCVATDCTIGGPKELKKVFGNQLVLVKTNDPDDLLSGLESGIKLKRKQPLVPDELSIVAISKQWIDFIKTIIQ